MIDELREEEIIKKVGGRFRLSTLIQKRLVQLNAGSRPLVDAKNDNKMQVVINEILQDKIFLDTELNVQMASGGQAPGVFDLNFDENP
jgi:DNA-directed RNA polymerase subunit omega